MSLYIYIGVRLCIGLRRGGECKDNVWDFFAWVYRDGLLIASGHKLSRGWGRA